MHLRDEDVSYTYEWEDNLDVGVNLPPKTSGRLSRNLRFRGFSLYRRLFGVVFVTNIAVLVAIYIKAEANAKQLGQIAIANLFVAILMRQDYVVNAFFTACCAAPTSWPLWIRCILGKVYSIGGLHSGCAVSGTMWLLAFSVQATREVMANQRTSAPTLAVTYTICALLIGMLLFAYPQFRSSHHNTFEMTHRFVGWATIALVWAQVVLLSNDYREPTQSLQQALIRSPPFWLVLIMNSSIILTWLRLRKVPVRAEVLSEHAVRLYFDYTETKPGHFTRLSTAPMLEWHSFATISEPGKSGYSVIVSRAGDWTAAQIADQPTALWIRGIPCYGVVRIVPLFRRVLLVATGSGIGPIAPVVFARRMPIQLLWVAPAVRKTFGDDLVDSLLAAVPNAVVHDTSERGRPDMVRLTYRLVQEFSAEAVVIISNKPLTEKLVYGMTSRGIPAFGAYGTLERCMVSRSVNALASRMQCHSLISPWILAYFLNILTLLGHLHILYARARSDFSDIPVDTSILYIGYVCTPRADTESMSSV
ncbi:hypothetical protein B0H21DRAFT_692680 [Amylocystis lapponica]|nr:hypothetical protein B0H21DRAFT_692680 [Amylocystis lapponica]